jgi:hypothetical protein
MYSNSDYKKENPLENLVMSLHEKLDKINKIIDSGVNVWLDNSDVMRKLKISSRLLQQYRDLRVIKFYKRFGKIWYKASEVDAFVEAGASTLKQKRHE